MNTTTLLPRYFFAITCFIVFISASSLTVYAQESFTPEGRRILQNKTFDNSEEMRNRILEAYEGLRVTDIIDGLDLIGLQDIQSIDKRVRPLWRDVDNLSHTFVGFAYTIRFVPTDVRVGAGSFENIEEAKKWKREQYGRTPSWMNDVAAGDVLVIDANDIEHSGFIGSNNSLTWALAGLKGVVTNGYPRDTDEIIKEKPLPIYCKDGYSARGIRPGRLIAESYNFPVNCGGVLVYLGDVIVGVGDGVVVVPRAYALKVPDLDRGVYDDDQAKGDSKKEKLR